MNIDKMINMLLLKISKTENVFYMERITYKNMNTYKSFIVNIGGVNNVFTSKRKLLIYLSKFK